MPDDRIFGGWEGGHIFYADHGIHTMDIRSIAERNQPKREGIEILLGTNLFSTRPTDCTT